MSNNTHYDNSIIKEENKNENPIDANQDNNEEDILEKINKQIEFLKNKFEVTKMVDKEERQENDTHIRINNFSLKENDFENNQEIFKTIKDEKYIFFSYFNNKRFFNYLLKY